MTLLLVLVLVLVAAGCGSGDDDAGEAQLWVTRDRGETVLYEETVPAGLTVMQALDRVADVETRYGSRFVQSIDGVEGSLRRGTDWFYFVNGVAADRGAAEYRLRDGEIAWWDYRKWRGEPEVRVVVGAFPEPFRHGYGGDAYATVVHYEAPFRGVAERLADVVGGGIAVGRRPNEGANEIRIVRGRSTLVASLPEGAGGRVRFVISADVARALADDPSRFRFKYEVRP